jgi:hypothetical protein
MQHMRLTAERAWYVPRASAAELLPISSHTVGRVLQGGWHTHAYMCACRVSGAGHAMDINAIPQRLCVCVCVSCHSDQNKLRLAWVAVGLATAAQSAVLRAVCRTAQHRINACASGGWQRCVVCGCGQLAKAKHT